MRNLPNDVASLDEEKEEAFYNLWSVSPVVEGKMLVPKSGVLWEACWLVLVEVHDCLEVRRTKAMGCTGVKLLLHQRSSALYTLDTICREV